MADTLESLETFSGFQKTKMSVNCELLSSSRGGEGKGGGAKRGFIVRRDSHNHRPQCGKKVTLQHTGLLEGMSERKPLQESNENVLPALISEASFHLTKGSKTSSLSLFYSFPLSVLPQLPQDNFWYLLTPC